MEEDIALDINDEEDTLSRRLETSSLAKYLKSAKPTCSLLQKQKEQNESPDTLQAAPGFEITSFQRESSEQIEEPLADPHCYLLRHDSKAAKKFEDSVICQMEFQERIKYFEEKKKAKENIRLMEKRAEQEAECSFKPQVNRLTRRNLEEFLDDQQRFIQAKASKIAHNKKRCADIEAAALVFAPQINHVSKSLEKIIHRNGSNSPINRENKWKAKMKLGEKKKELSRNKSFEARCIGANKPKGEALLTLGINTVTSPSESKSQMLVSNKFRRELEQSVIRCCGSRSCDIPFSALPAILEDFGMIKSVGDKTQQVFKLIQKMWDKLDGEQNKGILFSDLFSFILAIMKITPNYNCKNSERTRGKSKDNEISKLEANEIHSQFKLFYLNKISHKKQNEYKEEHSFKPSLSKATARLAEKSREKRGELMKTFNEGKHDLHSILYSVKQAQQKQVLEKQKSKPQPIPKPKTKPEKDHNIALYKKANRVKKRDRSTEEIEYERSKNQLTFAPRLNTHRSPTGADQSSTHKGISDSIERYRRARREKESVEFAKSKGLPIANAEALRRKATHPPNSKAAKQSFTQTRKPILQVDIRINEKAVESCIIYEGENAQDIAQRLAQVHNLDKTSQEEVYQKLEASLKSLLV